MASKRMTAEEHDLLKFAYRRPAKKKAPARKAPPPPVREKVSIEELFTDSDISRAEFFTPHSF